MCDMLTAAKNMLRMNTSPCIRLLILFLLLVFCNTSETRMKPLKCYTCDSREDPKCGETWMIDDPDKYIVECKETQHTCRKFVINMLESSPAVVTRGCHAVGMVKNRTKPYLPNKCREDENGLTYACHCTKELCNGQQRNIVNIFTFLLCVFMTVAAYEVTF